MAGRGLCNSCYVRTRYEEREPVECPRCGRMLRPFAKGLCKSCYQVLRTTPDATVRGTAEHSRKMSVAGIGRNRRERSGRWKGGRFVGPDGYVRVLPPDDYAGPRVHSGRYINEHRLVMEQHLGRPLTSEEVVHHVNRDRADNRIENLQLLPNRSAHRRLHAAED